MSECINETVSASSDSSNVNSLVKLLSLSNSARLPEVSGDKEAMVLDLMRSEIKQMRSVIERMYNSPPNIHIDNGRVDFDKFSRQLSSIMHNRGRIDDRELLRLNNEFIVDLMRSLRYADGSIEAVGLRHMLQKAEELQKGLRQDIDIDDL